MKKLWSLIVAVMVVTGLSLCISHVTYAATVGNTKIVSYKNMKKGVKFSWNKAKNAEGYALVRYTLVEDKYAEEGYREIEAVLDFVDATTTSFTDTPMGNGDVVAYFAFPYRIVGDDIEYGECEAPGYTVFVKPVKISSVENERYGIRVKWKANQICDGYQIYASINGGKYKFVDDVRDGTEYFHWYVPHYADVNYKIYGYVDIDDDGSQLIKSYGSTAKGCKRYAEPEFIAYSKTARVLSLEWDVLEGATGYEIRYAKNADPDTGKTVIIKKGKTCLRNIKGPVRDKKYNVKMRAVFGSGDHVIYGPWSITKTVKIAK